MIKLALSEALAKRNKRENDDMSLNQLAKETGIARQTLTNWENGESLKTLNHILKLSEFLGVDMKDLIKTKKK
jgi:transcriptional regulator with XRE-family HTH domain